MQQPDSLTTPATAENLGAAQQASGTSDDGVLSFLDASWSISDHSISVADILLFVSVLVITQVIVWIARFVINRAFRKKGPEAQGKRYTLQKLASYFLFTIGIIVGIDTVGIDITILIAGATALLVGVGLGIQHIFDDIISGFIILFEGIVKVGDIIEVDGIVARVDKIDIRTTKVYTRSGNYIVMPNSKITTENMTNWSMEHRVCRFKIDVGVAYGSDTALVKQLLLECAKNQERILQEPPARVDFVDFSDSALSFRLYVWALQTWEIEITLSELRFKIDKAFRENGIKIPFPQREIHVTPLQSFGSGDKL